MPTSDKATEPPKSLVTSKTIIVNLIIALSAMVPAVQAIVQAHPTETLIAVGVLNGLLRYITKGRVVLFPE